MTLLKRWNATQKWLLPGILALFLIAGIPADSRAASDAWIQTQLVTTYTLNEHLNPFDIGVKVADGVVTLNGEVETGIEKDLAGQIARSVDGVKAVENHLAVAPDPNAERQPAGFYRSVTDATITAAVKSNLLWNQNVEGTAIEVSTENGVVRLAGTAASGAERDLAVQLARNTQGVKSVQDEIAVGDGAKEGKKGRSMLNEAAQAVSDTYLTGRIKTVLMASKGMDGADVNVDTDQGVVTLTGTVASKDQAEHVVRVVDNVESVRDVVSKLTVR